MSQNTILVVGTKITIPEHIRRVEQLETWFADRVTQTIRHPTPDRPKLILFSQLTPDDHVSDLDFYSAYIAWKMFKFEEGVMTFEDREDAITTMNLIESIPGRQKTPVFHLARELTTEERVHYSLYIDTYTTDGVFLMYE